MNGIFTSPQIAWGPGAIEQLADLGARRAFLVVDAKLASSVRVQRVSEELAKGGAGVRTVAEVTGEPTFDSVDRLVPVVTEARPDWIVAIGGGSTIDTAKALWIRYAQPALALSTVTPLTELRLRASARFAALPTTCGSGSEVTWVAHLNGPDSRFVEVASRELAPDWALLDPTFLATLSPEIRASTGADAVAHALEAVASNWANPFSDALAHRALAAAMPALARVRNHPEDDELAGTLQIAACQAGLAVANSQVGVGHALAHALGAEFRRPHGLLVAALLPYVTEFNYPSARDAYAVLAPVFGSGAGHLRTALSDRLRSVWASAGLPKTLVEAGIPADRLAGARESIAQRASASPGAVSNPRVPTPEELGRLLDAAATGAAVTF
ncbi:MAG TPA: iron-containing alcohol dehydrogenase [Thermoplasmata archaeon]|nr:iron-containing alcohol dehydrogenase [Thermoplasmata archaeon]